MNKEKWGDIRKSLKDVNRQGLIKILSEVYKLNKQNKLFLHARFNDPGSSLKTYKEIIKKNIYPDDYSPWEPNIFITKAKTTISDYKKALGKPEELLDLMLYYCECGVTLTLRFGHNDNKYYSSMYSMYKNAFKLLKQNPEFSDIFLNRFEKLAKKTNDYGWGLDPILKEKND